jgi:hypothetical protein
LLALLLAQSTLRGDRDAVDGAQSRNDPSELAPLFEAEGIGGPPGGRFPCGGAAAQKRGDPRPLAGHGPGFVG